MVRRLDNIQPFYGRFHTRLRRDFDARIRKENTIQLKTYCLNIRKNLQPSANCSARLSAAILIPFSNYASPRQAYLRISRRLSILKALPICFPNSSLNGISSISRFTLTALALQSVRIAGERVFARKKIDSIQFVNTFQIQKSRKRLFLL